VLIGGAPMARYCTNCGHELRDGDKFCSECGTPVGSLASSPLRPRWETCEITCREVKAARRFTKVQLQFVAAAIGRVGRYVAAESEVFPAGEDDAPDYSEPDHMRILTALITRLTADGWNVLPDRVEHPVFGYLWYGYRFHRLIRS